MSIQLKNATRVAFLGAATLALSASSTFAVSVFTDDFEGDLSGWLGKAGGPPTPGGQIVADPLDPTNNVLNFSRVTGGGDIFTSSPISTTGSFTVSFDFLGTRPGNSGGYMGFSNDFPGYHEWPIFTGSGLVNLVSDGAWHSYTYTFTPSASFGGTARLMIEDFSSAGGGIPGDAYFDNIVFHDSSVAAGPALPDGGSTAAMLLLGMVGLAGAKRRLADR